MILPAPIQNLINALSRLPGIGPKTASRLTFFLLNSSEDLAGDLAEALQTLKTGTARCSVCFNITNAGQELCEICASAERDGEMICVVEEPLDVLAMERIGSYQGRYHVLNGALSPIEGIGPEDLTIRAYRRRRGSHPGYQSKPGRGCDRHVPGTATYRAGCAGYPTGTWAAGRWRPGVRRSEHPIACLERPAGYGISSFKINTS